MMTLEFCTSRLISIRTIQGRAHSTRSDKDKAKAIRSICHSPLGAATQSIKKYSSSSLIRFVVSSIPSLFSSRRGLMHMSATRSAVWRSPRPDSAPWPASFYVWRRRMLRDDALLFLKAGMISKGYKNQCCGSSMRWAGKISPKTSPPTLPEALPHRSERSTLVIGSCHGSRCGIRGEKGKWRNGEKEEKSKGKKGISVSLLQWLCTVVGVHQQPVEDAQVPADPSAATAAPEGSSPATRVHQPARGERPAGGASRPRSVP